MPCFVPSRKKPGRRAIHLSAAERNRATGYTYAGIQEAVRWIERNTVETPKAEEDIS
jgi:hypothetical protein